jgi:hypothetical protein
MQYCAWLDVQTIMVSLNGIIPLTNYFRLYKTNINKLQYACGQCMS